MVGGVVFLTFHFSPLTFFAFLAVNFMFVFYNREGREGCEGGKQTNHF
jgi:hypothetical protein